MLRAVASAAVALGIATGATPASAEPDPAGMVSLSVSYGTFSLPDEDASTPQGTAVGVDVQWRLTDAIATRVSATGGYYPIGDARYTADAVAGLVYRIDAVDPVIPYATGAVGGVVLGGGATETALHPLVEIGGGVDLRISRRVSWGVQGRVESVLQRTSLFSAGLRLSIALR